ncbi:MAG: hypothetical protein Q9227_009254 [Pyrenula ochraceoflavens]
MHLALPKSFLNLSLVLISSTFGLSQYQETLSAAGLIGSHFGIPFFNATFDYVVIGGGTAGLTVASRLAENTSNSVAVIEAGSLYELDNGNLSTIPGYGAYWLGTAPDERNPLVDWEIYTEPMTGFGDRSLLYTQGKTLGGSSARNLLLYMRSVVGAYQRWADAVDDVSYTWEQMLPFLQKSVAFDPPNEIARLSNDTTLFNTASFGANNGPVRLGYPNFADPMDEWIEKALSQLGLDAVPGFTNGQLLGYAENIQTINGKTQTRTTSETGFLRQALMNSLNMAVYQRTLAKRILFDANKTASGVLVNTAGVEYVLSATKEVVLSAGAFRSPQMLMVSGIGPSDTLEKYNIPVLSNRPGVGQNMWDHVIVGSAYQVDVLTHSALQSPAFSAQQVELYHANRTGMLTQNGAGVIGWEKLPDSLRVNLSSATLEGLSQLPADWPEIEFLFLDAYSGYMKDLLTGAPVDGKMYCSSSTGLIAPFSRGNVTINSTDTANNPVVQPNLLGDPRDQEMAIAAFKRARQAFNNPAIAPVIIGEEAFPGRNVSTDAEILDFVKNSGFTVYHAAATNAMGRANDTMAVVDSKALVIGVDRLRVVDVSAFPFLPPGHPQGVIYGLAEKIAAEMLSNSP